MELFDLRRLSQVDDAVAVFKIGLKCRDDLRQLRARHAQSLIGRIVKFDGFQRPWAEFDVFYAVAAFPERRIILISIGCAPRTTRYARRINLTLIRFVSAMSKS